MFKIKCGYDCWFWVLIFCLGLFLRLKLYFLGLGLHSDEANLALNLIDTSYFGLFAPLNRLQIAPPLFLVAAKFFHQFSLLHFTPLVSDLMLRFIPLISGVLAIPAFGYLLNTIFKNKFITSLGMLIFALNPTAISYSCVFKQYSTELLIAICILILCTKIDFSSKKNFILLGLTPFFSLSSFFVLAGSFCYLAFKAIAEKKLKEFIKGFFVFLLPTIIFTLLVLIPVYSTHYGNMAHFWDSSFSMVSNLWEYSKVLMFYLFRTKAAELLALIFATLGIVIFIKKRNLFCLGFIPIVLCYLLTIGHHYPLDERFVLFLLPSVLLILIYPLTLIPERVYNFKPIILQLLIVLLIIFGGIKLPPVENLVIKQESAKNVWEYLEKNYDGETPVLIGYSLSSNLYYRMFYFDKFKFHNAVVGENYKEIIKNLPAGNYYLVISRYEHYDDEFFGFLNSSVEIIGQQEFEISSASDVVGLNTGRLIKFYKR